MNTDTAATLSFAVAIPYLPDSPIPRLVTSGASRPAGVQVLAGRALNTPAIAAWETAAQAWDPAKNVSFARLKQFSSRATRKPYDWLLSVQADRVLDDQRRNPVTNGVQAICFSIHQTALNGGLDP